MRNLAICTSLFFYFISGNIAGQSTLRFETYNLEDGLPSNETYRLTEDEKGQLWVSTANGVVYFDGNRFRAPDFLKGTNLGLVEGLIVLDDKNMWFSDLNQHQAHHYNGTDLRTIHARSTRFMELQFDEHDTSLVTISPIDVTVSNRDTFICHPIRSGRRGLLGTMMTSIEKIDNDRFLVGSSSGTYVYENGNFSDIEGLTNKPEEVYALHQDHTGLVSALVGGKIYFLDQDLKLYDSLAVPETGSIRALCSNGRNDIWIATSGMRLFQYHHGRWIDQTAQLSLENQHINYLYLDKHENLWISTNYDGLICVLNGPFEYISVTSGLGSNFVNRIAPIGDQYLAATGSGVSLIDPKLEARPFHPKNLKNEYCHDILLKEDNQIFVAISNRGLLDREAFVDDTVHAILASSLAYKNDTVYCGTYAGSVYKYIEGEMVRLIRLIRFPRRRTTDMIHLDNGLIAIGTKVGLNFLYRNRKSDVMMYDWELENDIPALRAASINDLHLHPSGTLLIASSIGLFTYKDGIAEKVNIKGDNQICMSVSCDANGSLFVGTKKGLFHFTGNDTLFLGVHSGLLSNEVNYLYYEERLNRLWVGGNKGLAVIDLNKPESLRPNYPEFALESFELIPGDPMPFLDKPLLEFSHDQNNLRFKLKRNGQPGNRANAYYQVNATNGKWFPMPNDILEFYNQNPGHYDVYVRMAHSPYDASEPIKFSFYIAEPFWKSSGFQLGAGLAIIAAFFIVLIYREKQVRRQEQNKQNTLNKVKALELRSLTAMMNPHFLFNSLNTVQHFASKYRDDRAIHYISGISRLLKLQLESLFHSNISLDEEIKRLQLYVDLEAVRLDSTLVFDCQIQDGINARQTLIPSMMLQPFVENALWHGLQKRPTDKKLEVKISRIDSEYLKICVEDNGVGFKNSKKAGDTTHISRGMQLIGERLSHYRKHRDRDLLHITPLTEDDQFPGTRVCFELPYKTGMTKTAMK